jgi:rSAM/selenodomain-associated transferase 2
LLVSIIIPVFNDAQVLAQTLRDGSLHGAEVIVATAIGDTSTVPVRTERRDIVWIDAPRGRGTQMNAGAAVAHGDWLIFLHADTTLPAEWPTALEKADADRRVELGCFRFALDARGVAPRLIELGVRLRVRVFGMPYGDQALFLRRKTFTALGGYRDLPIMEDVDLVRRVRLRARRRGWLFRARAPALTSPRRWQQDGWIRRTARHVVMIALYLAGLSPLRLARIDRARFGHPDGASERKLL